ncbi:hypothetical protein EB796_020644 [Bugula neritina]|uniref:Uncharacterized protein n=1 Tax=Bugula neritina TaxID=10212 RepID=A0A7J7J552_BUGNE|nr:hypothetical protein EB796_020644 [Bugula neritina]
MRLLVKYQIKGETFIFSLVVGQALELTIHNQTVFATPQCLSLVTGLIWLSRGLLLVELLKCISTKQN